MNNTEIENLLIEHGFTYKELAVLKKHVEEDGHPYSWLLSDLKRRFLYCGSLMLIFLVIWGSNFLISDHKDIIMLMLTTFTVVTTIYFAGPMKLALKGFIFLRKKGHLL